MNSIYELEAQNLQDTWSLLYLKAAGTVLSGKERGEELVRKANRRYGELIGEAERTEHRKNGIKVNLMNFYVMPRIRFVDPRLVEQRQRLNEQTALSDIIRCPFASCARLYQAEKEAKLFCEEFLPSCIGAYTENTAQVNISEVLTEPRNNRCRIASYYRPGNVETSLWKEHFSQFEEPKEGAGEVIQNGKDAREKWNRCADLLVQAFGETVPELSVQILEAAGTAVGEFLKMRAKCMEQQADRGFAERNCALEPDRYPDFGKTVIGILNPGKEV